MSLWYTVAEAKGKMTCPETSTKYSMIKRLIVVAKTAQLENVRFNQLNQMNSAITFMRKLIQTMKTVEHSEGTVGSTIQALCSTPHEPLLRKINCRTIYITIPGNPNQCSIQRVTRASQRHATQFRKNRRNSDQLLHAPSRNFVF